MLGNIGPFEIIIVLIVALIVFGPKRLPELGSSLGKGIREFKESISGEKDDDAGEDVKAIGAPEAAAAPVEPPTTHRVEADEVEVAHDKGS